MELRDAFIKATMYIIIIYILAFIAQTKASRNIFENKILSVYIKIYMTFISDEQDYFLQIVW